MAGEGNGDCIGLGVVGTAYDIAIAEIYPAPIRQHKAQVSGIPCIRIFILPLWCGP
ncbi:MAG: hypothetical protein JNK00_01715 [Flavipsychrobacter sp.]|nr:hypothetical protein [Flavipsychrobacter sp.]